MTLAEIIKTKRDNLYETYNNINLENNKEKIESLKEDINKLTNLIEILSKDTKNLKNQVEKVNYEQRKYENLDFLYANQINKEDKIG